MDFIDYYKVLELDKNASEADIKKAYRKFARKYHPDLNPNDESSKRKFQAINEANEVLSDPEKRKKYDQYGKDWMHSDQFEKRREQKNYGSGQEGWSGNESDFSDFFSSMFGGFETGSSRSEVRFKGQDYNAELNLNLMDAFKAHAQTITINDKKIRITIPAGIENGQVIKIAGYGGPGSNGGPNGDLYITFSIQNQTKFKRDGSHLYKTEDIDLYTAVLGGEITVETMDGKIKFTIPPETQNGTRIKLKGKGFPIYKKEGQFGDLFITYQIKIPTRLSDQEKELFGQLKQIKNEKE